MQWKMKIGWALLGMSWTFVGMGQEEKVLSTGKTDAPSIEQTQETPCAQNGTLLSEWAFAQQTTYWSESPAAKTAEESKEMVEKELAEIRSQMQARTYQDAQGKKLLYRLWVPGGYDPGKKYPLILFLHGAGERGEDNQKQLAHPDVLHWVRAKYAKEHPSFLVAPQCPAESKWVEVNWWQVPHHQTPAQPAEPMRLTMELLDALQKEFSIDPDRIYVTGLSMGGYGTFDLLARRPKYFAAAVPLCGGADDNRAKDFAHVPIWIFHGAQDKAVPVVRSRSVVEALRKAGGQPRYTEYPDEGHGIWKRVYADPELAQWLFAQVRPK